MQVVLTDQISFPAYPKTGIYFDSATIGLQSQNTIYAQQRYSQNFGSTVVKSLHKRSRLATELYLETKENLANFFGWSSASFSFQPNRDYCWNSIIYSLILKQKKPLIIANIYDDHALIAPLIDLASKNRIELKMLKSKSSDNLLKEMQNLKLDNSYVCLNDVSPSLGEYRKIQDLATIIHSNDSFLFVDYSRSALQNNVILDKDNVDLAVIDCSLDLLGPQMTAILAINGRLLDTWEIPFFGSGNISQLDHNGIKPLKGIEKIEIGNPNMSGIAGLNASLKDAKKIGKIAISNYRLKLNEYLISLLAEIPEIQVLLEKKTNSSIIPFSIEGINAHDVSLLLDETKNIELRSGMLCSHMGLSELGYSEALQLSLHIYNSKEELDIFKEAIEDIIQILQ